MRVAEPIAALPERFKVTLRPVGLGSLAGTGPSRPPEESKGSGAVLLNVLVVLEPLD